MKRALVLLLGAAAVAVACSSSSDDTSCTCSVSVNGDKKDLTCGQSACVGGSNFQCSDGTATKGNACTGSTSSSSSSSSSTSSSGGSSTSSSSSSGAAANDCEALETFCATKCATPEPVNKSCVDTAAGGDGKKCVAWRATNSSLCKP